MASNRNLMTLIFGITVLTAATGPVLMSDVSFASSVDNRIDRDSDTSGHNKQFFKPHLIAQAEGRKRSKNPRKADPESVSNVSSASEEKPSTRGGDHGMQERAGKYTWHAALLSDFRQQRTETKVSKGGSGNFDLDLMALYVTAIGLEVGGQLNYTESTVKGSSDDSTSKASAMLFRLKSVFNFGNIQKKPFIFFAGASLGFGSASAKIGTGDDAKTSLTRFGLGIGAHYFVDSNVAITGETQIDTGSNKGKGDAGETKVTDIHFLKLGFSLFI